MDQAFEKNRLQKQQLKSKVTALQKSYPQFRKSDMYFSALKCNLSIKSEAETQACIMQRLQIKKKEEHLLEKKIKDMEVELKCFRASQKDVCKTHSKNVQVFF